MFDKSRAQLEQVQARFAKFEEDHEAMRKVHQHFVKHQTVYACGATAVVSIVGTRMFGRPTVIVQNVMDKTSDAATQIPQIINNNTPTISPVIHTVIENTLNNGGPMRKIVGCVETGELWRSMSDAAKAQGKSLAMMSNHIHDRGVESINGLHFYIDAVTAD